MPDANVETAHRKNTLGRIPMLVGLLLSFSGLAASALGIFHLATESGDAIGFPKRAMLALMWLGFLSFFSGVTVWVAGYIVKAIDQIKNELT